MVADTRLLDAESTRAGLIFEKLEGQLVMRMRARVT